MIEVRITHNDLPKLLAANKTIANNTRVFMRKIGKALLDSAEESFEKEGPGWKRHAPATIARWGKRMGPSSYADYPLLHRIFKRNTIATRLSNVRANFTYDVSSGGVSTSVLRIVPKNPYAQSMYEIHNRPRGSLLITNRGRSAIPGRPFFRWRTTVEGDNAMRLMRGYVRDSYRSHGMLIGGIGFETSSIFGE